ncbi:MAG: glycosyltransferase [Chloroflexota bacterium]
MKRLAILSVHSSPIAAPGGKKVGGMNTYVREIALEFARQGMEVDIFTRRISPEQPNIDDSLGEGVNVVHVNAGSPYELGPVEIYPHLQQFTAGVIAHTIRHNISYDLVFSHYWLSGWVAQHLKEAWGTPFVQMFHTLGHMKNRIPSVTTPVPQVRIRTETQVVEWADMIVANTPAERAQLLWLYHADRRKIAVCPPGVNTERFHPIGREVARAALGISQDVNLLVFAGRIEPLKAVDSIIEALHVMQQQPGGLNKMRFAVIGGDPKDVTDPDMMALRRLTQEYGLDDVVSFVGAKNQNELVQWYAAATTVIMPSEYESFGMVALEAMATGTPVIASEVGGLAFLVRDGETGFLVPARSPEDLAGAITSMVCDPVWHRVMGVNAANLARSYAWDSIASRLLENFETLPQRGQRALTS